MPPRKTWRTRGVESLSELCKRGVSRHGSALLQLLCVRATTLVDTKRTLPGMNTGPCISDCRHNGRSVIWEAAAAEKALGMYRNSGSIACRGALAHLTALSPHPSRLPGSPHSAGSRAGPSGSSR